MPHAAACGRPPIAVCDCWSRGQGRVYPVTMGSDDGLCHCIHRRWVLDRVTVFFALVGAWWICGPPKTCAYARRKFFEGSFDIDYFKAHPF